MLLMTIGGAFLQYDLGIPVDTDLSKVEPAQPDDCFRHVAGDINNDEGDPAVDANAQLAQGVWS